MISIGKFISRAPAHPLTLAGYLFEGIALLVFVCQIFKWNIPEILVINAPTIVPYILASCIIIKGIIGRFSHVVIR